MHLHRGLSSHPLGGELPPETNLLPPGEGPSTPASRGNTCFDDQLTRPLHANLVLQHETEGIHTTKQIKIVGHYVNTTVEHYGSFRSQRWKIGEPSISCQNAPDCTKLRLKFQKFSRGDTPGPPYHFPRPIPAQRFAPRLVASIISPDSFIPP